jgi:hypothetical protein
VLWQPTCNRQVAVITKQAATRPPLECSTMWLLILEALLALGLFIFIVWWTMFHGRKRD